MMYLYLFKITKFKSFFVEKQLTWNREEHGTVVLLMFEKHGNKFLKDFWKNTSYVPALVNLHIIKSDMVQLPPKSWKNCNDNIHHTKKSTKIKTTSFFYYYKHPDVLHYKMSSSAIKLRVSFYLNLWKKKKL